MTERDILDQEALGTRFRMRALRVQFVPALALGLVLAAFPLLNDSLFALGRLELALTYLMAALALNFVFGYGGELAVGQPAMLAIAGYTAGILSVRYEWAFWITTPIAAVAGIIVSIFMGLPALRVRGWYLGVVGILGVSVVPDVINSFYSLTGGSNGLVGILPIQIGGSLPPNWLPYELILGMTLLFWLVYRNLIASGWGRMLLAYRDTPFASVASGVNPRRMRAALYILSGIPCGVAGALYAHSQQFISEDTFTTTTVLLLLGAVLLGGRGTNWGPVLGVTVFAGIQLYLGPFSAYNPLALGIGVLVAALIFKGGIIGASRKAWRRFAPSRAPAVRLLEMDSKATSSLMSIERPPSVEIHDLAKHFAGNVVLKGVDITIEGGKVITIIGPNGSGKTTLLNCVSGFVRPDEGSITLDGDNIVGRPTYDRAHCGIARTFQVPRLVEELTVRQNVELGVFGLRPQTIKGAIFRTPAFRARERMAAARATTACEALGLSERAMSVRVEELPLAVKRLVEIARALAADAAVICLDEPVAGLNEPEQARVIEVLRALADSGRAVLLIEHNLPFVLLASDELLLLRDGEVVDRGVPVDVKDRRRPLGEYFHTFTTKTDHIDQLEAKI
jgi:branched-chain amino acid transport system permease protein